MHLEGMDQCRPPVGQFNAHRAPHVPSGRSGRGGPSVQWAPAREPKAAPRQARRAPARPGLRVGSPHVSKRHRRRSPSRSPCDGPWRNYDPCVQSCRPRCSLRSWHTGGVAAVVAFQPGEALRWIPALEVPLHLPLDVPGQRPARSFQRGLELRPAPAHQPVQEVSASRTAGSITANPSAAAMVRGARPRRKAASARRASSGSA